MSLPTDEEIWQRVCGFASRCMAEGTPVYTLKEGVANRIVEVTDFRIYRDSDKGRAEQQSSVTRSEVTRLWRYLTGIGSEPQVLYFTHALMAAALDDLLEVVGGRVRRRARPARTPATRQTDPSAQTAELWDLLTEIAPGGEFVTYSDVQIATGIHRQHQGPHLERIEAVCERDRVPRLAVLVVDKNTRRPREGFIVDPWDSLEATIKAVRAYPWDGLANPFRRTSETDIELQLAKALRTGTAPPLDVYRRVRARGQGQVIFRSVLMDLYSRVCAFCECAVPEVLEAAHIHPWARCDAADRMNPRNGILLCANHHRMFDADMIIVSSDYRISWRKPHVRAGFPLNERLRLPDRAEHYPDPRLLALRMAR